MKRIITTAVILFFYFTAKTVFTHILDSIENRSITETSSVSRKHLRKPDKKYECAGRKGK